MNRLSLVERLSLWHFRAFIAAGIAWFALGLGVGTCDNNIEWQFLHMHLIYEGFIAMMMYAIVYYVFPRFLGFGPRFPLLTVLHFWWANIAFAGLCWSWTVKHHHVELSESTVRWGCAYLASVGLFVLNVALGLLKTPPRADGGRAGAVDYPKLFVLAALIYLTAGHGLLFYFETGSFGSHILHIHLLDLGFISMVLFAMYYFAAPAVLNVKWKWPGLIPVHFWLGNASLLAMGLLWPTSPRSAYYGVFLAAIVAHCASILLFCVNLGQALLKQKDQILSPAEMRGLSEDEETVVRLLDSPVMRRAVWLYPLSALGFLCFLFFSTSGGNPSDTIGWQFTHSHLLDMGFVCASIYFVCYFMAPRILLTPIQFPSLVPLHLYLGVVSLAGFGLMWRIHIFSSIFNVVMQVSGMLHLLSVALFQLNAGASFLLPTRMGLAMAGADSETGASRGPIRPETPLAEMLRRWPQLAPALLREGFTGLGGAFHREFATRSGASLAEACLRRGLDPSRVCDTLNAALRGERPDPE